MDSKVEEAIRSLLVPACDVYENDPNVEEHKVWTTRDGRKIPIDEMTNSHLRNALDFCMDWHNPSLFRRSNRRPRSHKLIGMRQKLKGKKLVVFDKYMNNVGHTRAMHLNARYKYLWQEAIKRGVTK